MKSQSALYKLNLSDKRAILNINRLEIRDVHFFECTIIYLYDARIVLKNSNGKKTIIFPQSICYIEKNTTVDIIICDKKKGRPYDVYNVDGDILNNICEIMSPLLSHFGNVNYPYTKVFSFTADDVDKKIFHLLMKKETPYYRKLYKLTYLLSKCDNIETLIYSLSKSKNKTITERLKDIIESDLSKTWQISDFAKILHMSESLIRKRLKGENINYNTLIVDIRMNYAFNMLMATEKNINIISREVGYVSTSYFISKFRNYFGITPKQFSIKVKNKIRS
ncbi:helix-turn-helix transcriptional regulator [Escherichia coli]|nr:helix-turn-helix transcriptional regulator [Escherichia coli]